MRRSLFITAAVALLTPITTLAGTATTAEFVSGTVMSIPAHTTGSLDTGSSTELRFRYGKSVFSLPYTNITHAEVTEPWGKHLWRVPVPKLGKSERFLNISYREGSDSRMLTFKAPTSAVKGLLSNIKEHREDPRHVTAAAPTTGAAPPPAKPPSIKTDTVAWWGDRYWRTTRNKAKWPDVPAENAPGVPAGTKD